MAIDRGVMVKYGRSAGVLVIAYAVFGLVAAALTNLVYLISPLLGALGRRNCFLRVSPEDHKPERLGYWFLLNVPTF